MDALRWRAEEGVSVSHALAMGRGLLTGDAPVRLYVAAPAGDARVLGAYQRREDALAADVSAPVFRRATGGPAAVLGEGVLYLALGLNDASALMECPKERVLNRNVRPLLSALRRLGGAAHYFGREHLSLDRRPAGLVAWTRTRGGAVLLELFLGASRSFALEEAEHALSPSAPRMMGKTPITAAELLGKAPTATELAQACAEACATMRQLEIVPGAFVPTPVAEEVPSELRWSSPREVPIGFVRAGLAIDDGAIDDEAITDAALTGDFFQDADAVDRLRAALIGPATPERVSGALNATYGPGGAVIEGLRSLQPVLDAFLELLPA